MNPTSSDLKNLSSGDHLFDYKLVLLSENLLSTNVLLDAISDTSFIDHIRTEMLKAEAQLSSGPSGKNINNVDTSSLKTSNDIEKGWEMWEKTNRVNGMNVPSTPPTTPSDFVFKESRERSSTLLGKVANVFASSFMGEDNKEAIDIEMTATIRSKLHRRLFFCEERNIEFESQKEKYDIPCIERNIQELETISDVSKITGHIILVGVQDELPIILRELRQPGYMNKQHIRPILILGDVHPSVYCPKLISNTLLEQVYYVKGTADLKSFLKDADFLGLKDCYSLNIFPTAYVAQNAKTQKSKDKQNNFVDSKRDDLEADMGLLFHYFSLQKKLLKIEKVKPTDYSCHMNLRLCRASNLPVLNAKAVRQVEKYSQRKLQHIFPQTSIFKATNHDDSFFHTSCGKKHEGLPVNENSSMLHLDKHIDNGNFWNFALSPFSLPMSASGIENNISKSILYQLFKKVFIYLL